MRILKRIIILFWTLVFLVILFLKVVGVLDTSSIIYWWLTLGCIFIIWIFRLKDITTLKISIGLFILCGALVAIGLEYIGEIGIRVGFIFLIVGFMQTLIEYKNPLKK